MTHVAVMALFLPSRSIKIDWIDEARLSIDHVRQGAKDHHRSRHNSHIENQNTSSQGI